MTNLFTAAEISKYLPLAAYRFWERAGRPEGRDLEFWLEAENLVARKSPIPHDEIAHLAYVLWTWAECPKNRSEEFWFKAIEILETREYEATYGVWTAPVVRETDREIFKEIIVKAIGA